MKASVTIQWDNAKREYYLKTIDNAGNSGTVSIGLYLRYDHELPKTVKRQAEKLANILVLNEQWQTAFNIARSLDHHGNQYAIEFIVQEYKSGRLSQADLYTLPLRFDNRHYVNQQIGL